jgi:hypothetical protein
MFVKLPFFVEPDLVFVPAMFVNSTMDRISRRDLHDHIFVAIKCAPPLVITGLRGKLPAENDKACDALTELILRIVDREHRGVFDWSPPTKNLFPKLA